MRLDCKAAVAAATLWAATAGATAPIDHVDNFALLDQAGKYHDLYYLSDAKAVVLMTHDDACKAVDAALPALEQAKASYGSRGVEFLMINSQDGRAAVAAKAKGSNIPVLLDETQLVSEALQLTRAGEVLVVDTKGWKIAYRGPSEHLTGALDSVRADRADADRQLRRLPSHGRHRPVADDELRHGQGLRPDDPRSRAHQAHAALAR
jgi:hypothetical protein